MKGSTEYYWYIDPYPSGFSLMSIPQDAFAITVRPSTFELCIFRLAHLGRHRLHRCFDSESIDSVNIPSSYRTDHEWTHRKYRYERNRRETILLLETWHRGSLSVLVRDIIPLIGRYLFVATHELCLYVGQRPPDFPGFTSIDGVNWSQYASAKDMKDQMYFLGIIK